MKAILKLLLICFPIVVFAATPAQQLSHLLSSYHTLTANFVQTLNGSTAHGSTTSGRMALQHPGKFRWEVEKPQQQIIIADGKTLWIYDVDLQQALQQNLNSQYAINPATLLSGSIADLQKYFTITRIRTKGRGVWFVLQPKQQNAMFHKISLFFINDRIKLIHIIDKMGNNSTISLSKVRLNITLNQAIFNFKAPAGVDVIRATPPPCDQSGSNICPIPVANNG